MELGEAMRLRIAIVFERCILSFPLSDSKSIGNPFCSPTFLWLIHSPLIIVTSLNSSHSEALNDLPSSSSGTKFGRYKNF